MIIFTKKEADLMNEVLKETPFSVVPNSPLLTYDLIVGGMKFDIEDFVSVLESVIASSKVKGADKLLRRLVTTEEVLAYEKVKRAYDEIEVYDYLIRTGQAGSFDETRMDALVKRFSFFKELEHHDHILKKII